MAHKAQPLKDEGTRAQVILAGGAAGLVSRFCIAPLDVIKIRLQLQTPHPTSNGSGATQPFYKGTFGALTTILRDEGLTAFWKGNVAAEALYVTYGAVQFSTYRMTTTFLESLPSPIRPTSSASSFLSGAFAGSVATTVTYPLDLLRTRFAAQGKNRVYTSLFHSIRDISRREGPRGFFQGLGAAVGQVVPYMGLFFAGYEALKLPLGELSLPIGSGDAAAGMLASIMAKTIVFPLDTVRKRLQVQGPTRGLYANRNMPLYKGVAATLRMIVRDEGLRGLYRGLPVSLIKAAPASAVTMWTYERTMKVLRELDE